MASGTFGTAINCIDGRAQSPVADWVKIQRQVSFVDMITIPGADKALTQGTREQLAALYDAVAISAQKHGSQVIAIAGHHDCAANPVSAEEHKQMIRQAVRVVESWGLGAAVYGLWVNDWFQVEVVAGPSAAP